jgi:hypothetical protein
LVFIQVLIVIVSTCRIAYQWEKICSPSPPAGAAPS